MSPMQYEIVVEGHLEDLWTGWFDGLTISYEGDENEQTVLTLTASDPARLHGVLAQIGSLNLTLVAVRRLE